MYRRLVGATYSFPVDFRFQSGDSNLEMSFFVNYKATRNSCHYIIKFHDRNSSYCKLIKNLGIMFSD